MLLQSDDAHVPELLYGKIQFSLNANKFASLLVYIVKANRTEPNGRAPNKVGKLRKIGMWCVQQLQ